MAIRSGAEIAARNRARQQTLRQAGRAVNQGLMTPGQAGGMIDPSMYGITNRNLQRHDLPLPDPSVYTRTPSGQYVTTGGPSPVGSGQNGGYGGYGGGSGSGSGSGSGGVGGGPAMQSKGWSYDQGPEQGMLQDVFNRATEGSIQNFNRAANRLRERTDASTAGALADATQRNLGRGFGTSGAQDAAIYRTQAAGQDAYAQGLVGLESEFEKNRLAGLNIAGDVANTQSRDTLGRNTLGMQNNNFIDKTLYDLLQSREGNQARQHLQDTSNQFQGNQNQLNRDFIKSQQKPLVNSTRRGTPPRSIPLTMPWGRGNNGLMMGAWGARR